MFLVWRLCGNWSRGSGDRSTDGFVLVCTVLSKVQIVLIVQTVHTDSLVFIHTVQIVQIILCSNLSRGCSDGSTDGFVLVRTVLSKVQIVLIVQTVHTDSLIFIHTVQIILCSNCTNSTNSTNSTHRQPLFYTYSTNSTNSTP